MKTSRALLIVLFLVCSVFTLAVSLQVHLQHWQGHARPTSIVKLFLGGSRRLIANQFFVEADVSFHSGYYPSIFDEAREAEERHSDVSHPQENEQKQLDKGFLGPPLDWVDRFGRHFRPVIHTHLHGSKIAEMLPWLRISADLDPHRVETYLVTAYWLERMGDPKEAVPFVRLGLRNNPGNPALLYELGWLFFSDLGETDHAYNVWLSAKRCWYKKEAPKHEPDIHLLGEILGGLFRVETRTHQPQKAIGYLQELKKVSPNPQAIQRLIDEVRRKASDSSVASRH